MAIYGSNFLGAHTKFNVDRPGDGHYDVDEWTKVLLQSDTTNGSSTFVNAASNAEKVALVNNGSLTHSTTQAKIGATSIYFAGGQRLDFPASQGWLFGADPLTIDFWFYPLDYRVQWFFSGIQDHNLSLAYGHQSTQGDSTGKLEFWWSTNGQGWNGLGDGAGNAGQGVAGKMRSGEWQHMAWQRGVGTADTWTIHWNGVLDMSTGSSGTVTAETDDGIRLGTHGGGSYAIYGYMDEFRISQGITRWTEDFKVDW